MLSICNENLYILYISSHGVQILTESDYALIRL